jgi:hypothetical protein
VVFDFGGTIADATLGHERALRGSHPFPPRRALLVDECIDQDRARVGVEVSDTSNSFPMQVQPKEHGLGQVIGPVPVLAQRIGGAA